MAPRIIHDGLLVNAEWLISRYNSYHAGMSIQQQAALSLLRAAELIQQDAAALLKPFDLSVSQFNVLRILRGSPDGLRCGDIVERMISRDPDMTRLLRRMEARKLIFRRRGDQDRRVVTVTISHFGLHLLQRVDPVINNWHRDQFAGMSEGALAELIELLQQIR